MSYTWVEPFAGAAAVALRLVGGRNLTPPVAWMGGKRRYARAIADAMGVPPGKPGRVLLADAGPWGWVWPLILDPHEADKVALVLRSWQGEDAQALWRRLAESQPFEDVHQRAAQWLWLQARSASGVPIWWDGWRFTVDGRNSPQSTWGRYGEDNAGRWKASDGRGVPRPAGQKALWRSGQSRARESDQAACQKGLSRGGPGGMVNPATIAERIEAIALAFECVEWSVFHDSMSGDAGRVVIADSARGGKIYACLDPPYVGATGYGWDCPRAEVLALARAWDAAGAVVAVSEAEPLLIQGWYHIELTRPGGKPEWLTLSMEPVSVPEIQGDLFGPVAGAV